MSITLEQLANEVPNFEKAIEALGLSEKTVYEDTDPDLIALRNYRPGSEDQSKSAQTPMTKGVKSKQKGGNLGSKQQKTSSITTDKAKEAGVSLATKAGQVKLQAFLETTVACEEEFAQTVGQVYDRMSAISEEVFNSSSDEQLEGVAGTDFLRQTQATLNSFF